MQNQMIKSMSRLGVRKSNEDRKSSMSHTIVKFTPHKLFPPRLKLRSQSLNPKLWNFKRKEQYLSSRPESRERPKSSYKNDKSKLKVPGPGQYQVTSQQKAPLGIIFKEPVHKFTSSIDNVGPGPGFYNITTVWKGRESKPSFNSTKLLQLFDLVHQPTPGPCDYQKQLGSKPIISKYRSSSTHLIPQSTRQSIIKQSKILLPGPGSYNISPTKSTTKKNPYKFLHRYMM